MLAISSWVMVNFIRGQSVEADRATVQLLLHRMMPIADRGLGHLRDQRLRVAQQKVHHRPAAIERLFQHLRSQPVT